MTKILTGDCRDVLKTLPDCSVHCCVTSPPYWGLRNYGHADQIGLEKTPEAYVAEMVAVFREVKRVLRDDGTLWLNLGDSYVGALSQHREGGSAGADSPISKKTLSGIPTTGRIERGQALRDGGLKPKDLVGIPWRVAFALQADGWYLRQDIIWHKPNPMPESVTDRCTKSHEYVFLLSKSARYYYDLEAIKEPVTQSSIERLSQPNIENKAGSDRVPGKTNGPMKAVGRGGKNAFRGQGANRDTDTGPANRDGRDMKEIGTDATRNKRSVWTVCTQPYSGAHFATFPPKLIEPMILAGCPAQCCPKCGKGWERVVEKGQSTYAKIKSATGHDWDDMQKQAEEHGTALKAGQAACGGTRLPNGTQPHLDAAASRTIGFRPACDCGETASVPGVVLDPFGGSGTTGDVASGNGRDAILIELNPEYVKLSADRGGLFVQ